MRNEERKALKATIWKLDQNQVEHVSIAEILNQEMEFIREVVQEFISNGYQKPDAEPWSDEKLREAEIYCEIAYWHMTEHQVAETHGISVAQVRAIFSRERERRQSIEIGKGRES